MIILKQVKFAWVLALILVSASWHSRGEQLPTTLNSGPYKGFALPIALVDPSDPTKGYFDSFFVNFALENTYMNYIYDGIRTDLTVKQGKSKLVFSLKSPNVRINVETNSKAEQELPAIFVGHLKNINYLSPYLTLLNRITVSDVKTLPPSKDSNETFQALTHLYFALEVTSHLKIEGTLTFPIYLDVFPLKDDPENDYYGQSVDRISQEDLIGKTGFRIMWHATPTDSKFKIGTSEKDNRILSELVRKVVSSLVDGYSIIVYMMQNLDGTK